MIKIIKKTKSAKNILKIFYLLITISFLVKTIVGLEVFKSTLVLIALISLILDMAVKLVRKQKGGGFFSKLSFASLKAKDGSESYGEHILWITLAMLAIYWFTSPQIHSLCFLTYGVAKSFSYIIGKQISKNRFYESTIGEASAFFVIGLIVLIYIAGITDIKVLGLFFIIFAWLCASLADARRGLVKFNNPTLSMAVFTVILTTLNGIWGVL